MPWSFTKMSDELEQKKGLRDGKAVPKKHVHCYGEVALGAGIQFAA